MHEWICCGHCNLKHRQRPNGECPRCRQPTKTAAAAEILPDLYDDLRIANASPVVDDHGSSDADSPWTALAGGLFLLGCAYFLHGAFVELASGQRESIRVWWGIALLYKSLGPGITVTLVGCVGAGMTWTGLRRLLG
ncbi:MAG TPA: hypothetical protein VMS98_08910 [Thermoanaerobaculia bacterium]|nr:hypothetical protein [Thermoanaerobaculia bacterium]